MSDQLVVEREGLEKKDKTELQTIVSALGGSAPARMKKAELIDQILELSGASARVEGGSDDAPAEPEIDNGAGESGEIESGDIESGEIESGAPSVAEAGGRGAKVIEEAIADDHPIGPDGEPLADWEIKVLAEGGELPTHGKDGRRKQRQRNRGQNKSDNGGKQSGDQRSQRNSQRGDGGGKNANNAGNNSGGNNNAGNNNGGNNNAGNNKATNDAKNDDDDDDGNSRRSRRRRGRGRDRDDAGDDAITNEQTRVEGYLDLRDEGYAFLRVNGFLPSRDDAYVSVKQVRQFKLRKGDHLIGFSRPANRNEKNPALHEVESINGLTPSEMKTRVDFEDLTALFPTERLVLETKDEPLDMTARIIDLLAPIGKGQRGLIVSPPKAGKTSIMKAIARAIEANNPEVELLVLLVDERPEEVTEMKRHLSAGEVVSSTFDRPPEEHTAVAEITLERAKRMTENGKDVVLIVDGMTRLARAYNMAAPQSGRSLSGGIDAAALYPPKRFLGAARNVEEGGSLTILATALVETGSKMDEAIFEEFTGTSNMELRLDRSLAEKRIFPAIDVDGSSTRSEELLRDDREVEASWKLRRMISEMRSSDDGGGAASGIQMLVERLGQSKTNDDFLDDIRKY